MSTADTFTLLHGRLRLHRTAHNPSEESLWLASQVPVQAEETILDAGCGSGVIGLALLATHPLAQVVGMDINPSLVAQAQANAALNAFTTYKAVVGDFAAPPFPAAQFDHVVSNLPYHAAERGHTTPNTRKAQAHTLPPDALPIWLNGLRHVLKPTGTLHVLLHVAETAAVEHYAATHTLTCRIAPWQPHPHKAAKRILVQLLA
ncbi:MAG: methyltransferase domain-containing protein [Alphaproteobacteria bacterium]